MVLGSTRKMGMRIVVKVNLFRLILIVFYYQFLIRIYINKNFLFLYILFVLFYNMNKIILNKKKISFCDLFIYILKWTVKNCNRIVSSSA